MTVYCPLVSGTGVEIRSTRLVRELQVLVQRVEIDTAARNRAKLYGERKGPKVLTPWHSRSMTLSLVTLLVSFVQSEPKW
jgi:hypothetical protein